MLACEGQAFDLRASRPGSAGMSPGLPYLWHDPQTGPRAMSSCTGDAKAALHLGRTAVIAHVFAYVLAGQIKSQQLCSSFVHSRLVKLFCFYFTDL